MIVYSTIYARSANTATIKNSWLTTYINSNGSKSFQFRPFSVNAKKTNLKLFALKKVKSFSYMIETRYMS